MKSISAKEDLSAQDITVRKKIEARALRESDDNFRLLTEISPNAIFIIQEERIVYVNSVVIGCYGYTREEMIGAEFWRFVHEHYQDIARKRGNEGQQGAPPSCGNEYKIVTKDGSSRWVLATSASMEYLGGPALIVSLLDITETKRAEEALRESEARLRLAMDLSSLVQWEYDAITEMFCFDEHFYSLYGTSAERESGFFMLTKTYLRKFVHPDDIPDVKKAIQRSLTNVAGSPVCQIEHRIIRADGEERHISVRWEEIRDYKGRLVRIRGANQDITERKHAEQERKTLENQLHQSRKMEAIGQLAGGVAHDFNNILTAIMGFAEVMGMRLGRENPLQHHVSQILAASGKAVDLVNGLLAFSRKQILNKRACNVSEIIYGIKKLLQRLVPEDISFEIKCLDPHMVIMADRGQIEQVLMNLVTNARDAMPIGGVLTIEAGPYAIDEDCIREHSVGSPGTYARLTVNDTGYGMDNETRKRIFEPFFTTKKVGKGTGLGLSIIYGIIKQHNGFITVDSSPGNGSSFNLFLPLVEDRVCEQAVEKPDAAIPRGAETILLVEDDEIIRELNRFVLEDAGYSVIEAVDGRDAFEKLQSNRTSIDVLVTDVVMPNMDGKKLYEENRKIQADMKVLFMSGHADDILDSKGIASDGVNFMKKPFMPSELLRKLREILDRGAIS